MRSDSLIVKILGLLTGSWRNKTYGLIVKKGGKYFAWKFIDLSGNNLPDCLKADREAVEIIETWKIKSDDDDARITKRAEVLNRRERRKKRRA